MEIPYNMDISAVALVDQVRCPVCHRTIITLAAVTADLPPGLPEPVSIVNDDQLLGWATSCGCLISAVTYTLECTIRSGKAEVTAMRFVRNPVTRDLVLDTTAPRGLSRSSRDRGLS
jgi:hypothetical protein